MHWAGVTLLVVLTATRLPAQELLPPPLTVQSLGHMSRCQLEDLYRRSAPAPELCGYLPGWAKGRGCSYSKASQKIWKGKEFHDCELINHWACKVKGVKAQVAPGESWLDGGPALVMDYRGSSPVVWRNVRDELREVAPGLYLGAMFKDQHGKAEFVRFFVLEAGCVKWDGSR